jgi:protein SCO1/2
MTDLFSLFRPRPESGAAAPAERRWSAQDPRAALQRRNLPNVPLLTHAGRPVRFYDDLVRDRKVVINFLYTACSNICTPTTRHLLEARTLLGEFGRDIQFYSISLTPLDDDPPALRAYMRSFGIDRDPGWTFLTGKPEHIEPLRAGLGFFSGNPAEDADLGNHAGMVRIGHEAQMRWGHASALTSGRAMARMIRFELV